MGIFDRISNILKAKTGNTREQTRDLERNFSSVLGGIDRTIDQARDRASRAFGMGGSTSQPANKPQTPQLPSNEQIAETEKIFDKMIKEIDQAIEEARVYVAEFTSIENKLYQEKASTLERVKEWKDRAERAILTGRDDIARDALVRKQEYEQMVTEYQNQIDSQQSVSNQVKEQLQALVNKRAEAKRNRDLLISRQRSLQIQEKMNNAVHGKSGNMESELERIEKNLMQAEALAEAQAELQGYPRPSPNNPPVIASSPINHPTPVIDELSRLENKAVAEQQMKEIRNRFDPPKPKQDPWFAETPPPAPAQKKDVWFDNQPTKPSTPEKKDIWFTEENKVANSTTEPKTNIWFDSPTSQQTSNQTTNPTTNSIKRANTSLPNQNTLSAGANVSLSKLVTELKKLEVHLGWESTSPNLELNGSVILTTPNGNVRSDEDFIYYNTPISSCGAVKHLGGDGSLLDNEILSLNFTKIPSNITKLVFSVMIYEAETRRQTFQAVPFVWLRVINPQDGKELTNYLYTNRGSETVLILGEVYLYKGEWKFKAIGQGFAAGLIALLNSYGVTVD
ncbi:MAG: tellurium resistance protein TerD [bacterium]|nr:MAG: tellurium resistance protein TerD [bacterium]